MLFYRSGVFPLSYQLRKSVKMKAILTRSVVRDLVLILCCLSALFCRIAPLEIAIGIILLALGCLLHVVTKGILVRNVVLSDKGIYRFVRHPYYLSNYLIDSAFCMLSGNQYLLLIYPFLFFWAYGPTLRKEEIYLSSQHGAAFSRHTMEVPQLFPERTSLTHWRTLLEGFSIKRITWKECGRIARLVSLSLIIILIHKIRIYGLSGLLWDILRPTRLDYGEFLIATSAVLLYSISLLFLSWSKRRNLAPDVF
jgi:protein-S-isoprenylcysteine O-methyltransferase Ste14